MYRDGLIYEKIKEAEPKVIINAIKNARIQISNKNIIVIVEKKYYYFITSEDSIIEGRSYEGMDVLVGGFRKEKVDFEKIERIYFVTLNPGNSRSLVLDEIKNRCGLNNLKRKF